VATGTVPATRRKEAVQALVEGGDHQPLLQSFSDFFLFLTIPFCFRLIQWNPAPAPAANPALSDDSSKSYNYSPSRYGECDILRFKAECDESWRELGEVSKKAGIAELEWEHQRKQLPETIDGKSFD
jgi:hypothetical protein